MDDATRLFSLSIAMLVGCYFFGSIPLAVTMSEKRLRLISVLGAGLLVGTALAVIIPEGVHALYEGQHDVHHEHAHEHSPPHSSENELTTATVLIQQSITHLDHDHEQHGHVHGVEPEMFIGLSLCCGFVFMLLIDRISGGHSHGSAATDVESNNSRQRNSKLTATIGLVVHAAADGIALGAAASTSKTEVEIIVFMAIMLHKAPAAFGLSTFLLLEGLDRTRIRKHLLIFAAAAPLLALLTFFGLSQSSKEMFSSVNGTGIAMLFSAGTFLYVATVHVLPEATGKDCGESADHHRSRADLVLLVLGIVAPLFLSVTHSH